MAQKALEERYRRHELREHALQLPDTYIGSVEPTPVETYVLDDAAGRMVKRQIVYVPGLYKIYDEIIVNATDHAQRLKKAVADGDADIRPVKNIWVSVDQASGRITVINDGDGVDVEMHKTEKVYIPSLIFGTMLTSTNYDQGEEKVWGGKNGFGAKLTNLFSKEFVIETIDHRRKRIFSQRFHDNMQPDPPVVKASSKVPYTRITFTPDYGRFGLTGITDDIFQLFRKRVYDACAVTDAGINVFFNDVKLATKDFEKYADLYIGGKDERARAYEASDDGRWEVVATYNEHGQFEQVSFVNGISTMRGGKHVDYLTAQITKRMVELAATKKKKTVKVQHVKDNLIVFVKALITNPAFDSQSKETLTTMPSKFGTKFDISEKFMDKLYKSGLMERAISLTEFHDDKKLAKTDGRKQTRVLVNKLDDANLAGTKHSADCTLILTEGDSAKTMAIAGLSVVGRDKFGVFPLRGKILNVKDAAKDKIADNAEITNLKKIIGLEQGKDYKDLSTLRYGRIMIMCDQDVDGSHIKGLMFNVFQSMWPSLYRTSGFLTSMLTPIVKATNGRTKERVSFYNLSDFERWRGAASTGWSTKYFKGLGTSTADEAKEYFKDMKMTTYEYTDASDEALDLAFNKKRADDRKAWLMQYDKDAQLDYSKDDVRYEDFVNLDLIHFSNRDLERSINHMCDGLKESTRKILFGCFKKRLFKDEIRVAQLAGYISEVSAYHHGEASLQQAIIGMAQNFIGSNNINLLSPNGQFGTRIQGGQDAASPRYINTHLTALATKVYREEDNAILHYLDDDGVPVEPDYYIPIIPMVLLNGALGIGTGFSTNVPCHNPSDVIAMCLALIQALDEAGGDASVIQTAPLPEIRPWYMGFQGDIQPGGKDGTFVSRGKYRFLDDNTIEVTELPVGTWTEDYKDNLTAMVANGSPYLKDFENHYTDKRVKFVLKLYPGARDKIEDSVESEFKLSSAKNLSTNNMHLYNEDGSIQRFLNTEDIVRAWAAVRLVKYHERKAHQVKRLEEALRLIAAKCRFIQEIIDGKIKVMNVKAKEVDDQLAAGGYPKLDEGEGEASSASSTTTRDYAYLTKMPIYHLTFEKKSALEKESAGLDAQLKTLRKTPVQAIWRQEINEMAAEWTAYKALTEKEYSGDMEIVAKGKTVRRK